MATAKAPDGGREGCHIRQGQCGGGVQGGQYTSNNTVRTTQSPLSAHYTRVSFLSLLSIAFVYPLMMTLERIPHK